jgi:hypothetical protein
MPTIEVHRGHEVIGLAEDRDGVDLSVVAEGEPVAARARYLVGCDGANSFVRQHLGATVSDLGFFFDWLIVDVLPHAPRLWSPVNIQVCDPLRPTTLVSGGRGRRRWEFMRLPGESVDDLNSEATAWRLLEPWGFTAANATLERHAVYRFQARWVDTWRRGRMLIAGDAAHQMPPFAGQGMCSGLRDAANLAWKLDLILVGAASDALLDTYASERVPHVQAVINFSMELGKVICIADPAEAAARDRMMIGMVKDGTSLPPPSLKIGPGILANDPHAGELAPQGRVQHGAVSGLFDDVVGRGWTLLSRSGDPAKHLHGETAAFFASIGGISAHVGAGAPVRDLDGTYERWFDRTGVAVVLQRPDFYVFGTATALDDSGLVVEQLRKQLSKKP